MTSPAPISAAARLEELWRRIAGILESDDPLPARIAEAALIATGARDATVYLKERDTWVRTGRKLSGGVDPDEIPDPLPTTAFMREGDLWVPLATEGETHGLLRVLGMPGEEPLESAALLGFLFGSLAGAHRLARLVREAEFELKARLLELESLYDLGLSLGGQLDLSSLADEVLFRSISLTDAGKGTLVLLEDSGAVLLERSVGGEVVASRAVAGWRLPEGGVINNAADADPTAGMPLSCEKCLAVAISVPGRRLGVLAVADKESRDGRVLDFTPTDARLLSLFANQAAAAIETARLHKDALEKERIERSSSWPPRSSGRSCRATFRRLRAWTSRRATFRRVRWAATTSTSSRSPAGASPFSSPTSPERACRRRCSCRRCTPPFTSRSTRRRACRTSSRASTGTSCATPPLESS